MKLTTEIGNEDPQKISEIFNALISSGGLTGVKGGQTAIHFDPLGVFQKIELRYFPWQRRK